MEIKWLSAARLSPPRSRALENILPKRHRNQKRKQKRKRNNTWLLKGSKGGKIGGPKTCWHADRQGASAEGCALEYDAEQNVTEVQLADFSPELALKGLMGSIVAFHGTFFGAHTRYHIRPVLFAIDAETTAPTLHE